MRYFRWFGVFLLFLTQFSPVLGHGIQVTAFQDGIGIEVRYSNGKPMIESQVEIYSPGDRESLYQQGKTDRNGRFAFLPDTGGIWQIEVTDSQGHGVVEEIRVSGTETTQIEHNVQFRTWQKLLIGLGVISGITGIGFYMAVNRSNESE